MILEEEGSSLIRIAVCDDNKSTLVQLEKYIDSGFRRYTTDIEIHSFDNGQLLLNANDHKKFDVLFLDIDMPNITGFDIAKELRDSFENCYLIFISSHSDLVYKSLDFQPFNFIRKSPIELFEDTLNNVITKLMSNMKQNENIILEDEISGKVAVYYRNIIYIKSDRHYLYYYLQKHDEPIKIRGSINDIESHLEEYDFARIHRSIIINLRFVLSIDAKVGKVYIQKDSTQKALSLSKSYKESVNMKYTLYLRKTL